MEDYTNKFTIILNEDKSEAVLNFYQITAALSEGKSPSENEIVSEVVPVASLVMTGQCFRNLAASIQGLLESK